MADIDRRALARELHRAVRGEVRFTSQGRALYATDASNYRQLPIGVVIPRTVEDVVSAHALCREFGAPILPRGCGTSLSGETVNNAVVIDCSKYLREITAIDPDRRFVHVQPGAVNDEVNEAATQHGLRFGPDPSTHAYCTIGGNIGNNSCGVHSVLAAFEGDGARTSDNVHQLEVLTYDGVRMRVGPTADDELDRAIQAGGRRGDIYRRLRELRDGHTELIRERFPQIPRRVSGYNLDELLPERGFNLAAALCGTEGTCVTVLGATLKLVPDPPHSVLVVLGYDDAFKAADHVPEVMSHRPVGCEGMDARLIAQEREAKLHERDLSLLPEGGGWLLAEIGGASIDEAKQRGGQLMDDVRRSRGAPAEVRLYDDRDVRERLWKIREAGLAATAFPKNKDRDAWPGWEDSAVAPERLGAYLRELSALFDKYDYDAALYGHFGQGCVHCRVDFDLLTREGIKRYRSFMHEAADLVVSHGGSLSGEHGDGQARAELLPRMYGDEVVELFRQFKSIWDPDWRMNPGKVVDPDPLDSHLKLGPDYNPARPSVDFSYRQDRGDFAHAALRCVGVGQCRSPDGVDVMCPSYVATKEEAHSTRGRARLLFEMLEGDVVRDGWRSEEVHSALDLCLSCKGCTSDCPVHVDMPTLKAEFLHHHYSGRLRPRHAYAFGLIDQFARVASRVPNAVNILTQREPFATALKRAVGMGPERAFPMFARTTLRDWFARRAAHNEGGPRVMLWPDTFNNYLHPDVGIAAVEALEHAGYHVVMPDRHLCCGRPLYDYGMLDLARRYFGRILQELRDDIRAGVPLVGIEPSCLAAFKQELPDLLEHDDDAARLASQSFHFGEFLAREAVELPRLERRALYWRHCHQAATAGVAPEHELLNQMGVEFEAPTGSCCGQAGAWGFEAEHHEISMRIGEHVLLPEVRRADPKTIVIADGFSCKTQIADAVPGRRALHLAEVIALARRHGPHGPTGQYPERYIAGQPEQARSTRRPLAGVASSLAGALRAAQGG